MILKGRGISKGIGTGAALVLDDPFSFLGGVDPRTGRLTIASRREGENIAGRVLVFPHGKGSTVGSYTMMELRKNDRLPSAIINSKAETIVSTGAVMAGLPMIDMVDISLISDGDVIEVDGTQGTADLHGVQGSAVVTCVLRRGSKLLLLHRSEKVGTNKGKWAAVSGYIEEGDSPESTALREIAEEVGIAQARMLSRGSPLSIKADGRIWIIHPFLFEVDDERIILDWEHTEYAWVEIEELDRYDTVPGFATVLRSLLDL